MTKKNLVDFNANKRTVKTRIFSWFTTLSPFVTKQCLKEKKSSYNNIPLFYMCNFSLSSWQCPFGNLFDFHVVHIKAQIVKRWYNESFNALQCLWSNHMHLLFRYPYRKKSSGIRSDECGNLSSIPSYPIIWFPNF